MDALSSGVGQHIQHYHNRAQSNITVIFWSFIIAIISTIIFIIIINPPKIGIVVTCNTDGVLSSAIIALQELADLIATLTVGRNNSDAASAVSLSLSLQFHRPGPPSFQVISAAYDVTMTSAQCDTMLEAIRNGTSLSTSQHSTASSAGSDNATVIVFESVYPSVLRLPGSNTVVPLVLSPALYSSIALQLRGAAWQHGHAASLWWTVDMSSALCPQAVLTGASCSGAGDSGLVFNTVSDKIAPSFITSSFASYGVIAIYVTVYQW
jgi:hypothetical protein